LTLLSSFWLNFAEFSYLEQICAEPIIYIYNFSANFELSKNYLFEMGLNQFTGEDLEVFKGWIFLTLLKIFFTVFVQFCPFL